MALISHLLPRGLICGGPGTPLGETWVDLASASQVFYGLNGAGKTRLLEALSGALSGRAPGGRILARIPFDDDDVTNGLAWRLGEMLADDYLALTDDSSSLFETFEVSLKAEFQRRSLHLALGEVGVWGEHAMISWDAFFQAMACTPWWVFTPSASGRGAWTANPVVLVDEADGEWREHLDALNDLYADPGGPDPRAVGLAPLWWERNPPGAPIGIVATMLSRMTGNDGSAESVGWPFGLVVSDDDVDSADRTRKQLFAQRPHLGGFELNGDFARSPIRLDDELMGRASAIEAGANAFLAGLLADAPVLDLRLGDEQDWFLGKSCQWSATRIHGDTSLPLEALSFAEQRWAGIAIGLAIAAGQAMTPDPVEGLISMVEAAGSPLKAPEFDGSIWLLLDEPERGLHRTAEALMARGISELGAAGIRTVLATHSPELLDHRVGDVNYVRRRSVEGDGAVIPMAQFEAVRDSLGLNPSDLLRRTKGIALVEGEHDREVLRGMIGPELDELGVQILAVRGSTRLKTVVDSQFLYEFTDAVLFPILDGVQLDELIELWERHVLIARTSDVSGVVDSLVTELRKRFGESGRHVGEFLGPSLKNGTFDRVAPLGIPQPDVLACLPAGEFVADARTWEDLRNAATANNRGIEPNETQFKEYLRERGANLSPEHIGAVARSTLHPDIKALAAAIAERLAR